ncbi:XylR family transcriptional regulator [Crateriforma conspicua]|uniref:Xylose operon regulatory protein n=1 Tax=Crateriforma conspicua TaxID=2527996 RepID=A0A5C6FMK0_9PLAN|nr:DNA-binding transcriptional regulator [Crateriforma conspicua]TWU61858.1 Xylose operon regulatory protein [Crateriforma conspicua]
MTRRAVALLVETSNGYCRGLLDGINQYAKHQTDWSIYLSEQERGAMPPAWLDTWQGDGIVARVETDAIGRRLRQLNLPMVDLSAARHLPGVPWADTEDRGIAELAVEHFLDRGFRNLAFCGDPGLRWSNARRDWFRELATRAECRFFEHQTMHRYDPMYRWDRVASGLTDWLKSLPRPVAVMGCNDFLAHQVLDACRTLGISVPEQAAVLGVDNDRLICELSDPALSSVIPDTRRTGYEAAEMLDRMMNGQVVDADHPLITQPLGIRMRQSTDTMAIDDQDVVKALSFIRRHACENIRVADVLKQTELSRRALEHRFVKLVGRTPHDEMTRVRMDRVKVLLAETDISIHEISKRTGFEYPEYMAAAFKRATGRSPTEFRQLVQSDAAS